MTLYGTPHGVEDVQAQQARCAASSSGCSRCRIPPPAAVSGSFSGRKPRQQFGWQLQAGQHADAGGHRAEAGKSGLTAGVVGLARRQFQPCHGQHEARIDAVLALRDAMSAAGAHGGPTRGIGMLAAAQDGQDALGQFAGIGGVDPRRAPASGIPPRTPRMPRNAPAPEQCGSSSRDRAAGCPFFVIPQWRSWRRLPEFLAACQGDARSAPTQRPAARGGMIGGPLRLKREVRGTMVSRKAPFSNHGTALMPAPTSVRENTLPSRHRPPAKSMGQSASASGGRRESRLPLLPARMLPPRQ